MLARAFFAIILVILVPFSTNAQSGDEVTALANQKKSQVISKFGVSERTAESFLDILLSSLRAREVAKQDGTEVSRLRAEMLEKYAKVVLFGEVVVVRGTALLGEMKDGVPGTPVPEPLVKKVNAWASFAGKVLVMSADAGKTASDWATQRAIQSGYCDPKGQINFAKCEQILKETVDMIRMVTDHMAVASKAINVLVLTVPRMTY